MAQHVEHYLAHVFGNHVAAAADEGAGAGGEGKVDRGTRRTAETDVRLDVFQSVAFGRACGLHKVGDVTLDAFVHIHALHVGAGIENARGVGDGLHLVGDSAVEVGAHDACFFLLRGIVHDDFHHETVHLCFGQFVRTFLFDGVLRGEHEERLGQAERFFADGHLMLLHGFEQCALHLSRSAVDFVGKHEIRKNRAVLHVELLRALAVNKRANHVGGQEVGRELHAAKLSFNKFRQGLDSQCLGKSRHTFEQDVPVGQQGDEQGAHEVFLPHDGTRHAVGEFADEARFAFYQGVQFSDVGCFSHYYNIV